MCKVLRFFGHLVCLWVFKHIDAVYTQFDNYLMGRIVVVVHLVVLGGGNWLKIAQSSTMLGLLQVVGARYGVIRGVSRLAH